MKTVEGILYSIVGTRINGYRFDETSCTLFLSNGATIEFTARGFEKNYLKIEQKSKPKQPKNLDL